MAFSVQVEELVAHCKWPEAEMEQRHIDLHHHRTQYFNAQHFIQNESAREGVSLTWERVVDEAKCQERTAKEYHQHRKEKGDEGGAPPYDEPSLATDAMSRGYRKLQLRPRRQSGSGGRGGPQCFRCGKCNGCNGKKGTCPAWANSVECARSPTTTRQYAKVVPRRQEGADAKKDSGQVHGQGQTRCTHHRVEDGPFSRCTTSE